MLEINHNGFDYDPLDFFEDFNEFVVASRKELKYRGDSNSSESNLDLLGQFLGILQEVPEGYTYSKYAPVWKRDYYMANPGCPAYALYDHGPEYFPILEPIESEDDYMDSNGRCF